MASWEEADVVCAVDWTGLAAVQTLASMYGAKRSPPLVFLCYRVFSASVNITTNPDAAATYRMYEASAWSNAQALVVLSQADQRNLEQLQSSDDPRPPSACFLLYPPLRADMVQMASQAQLLPPARGPRYLTCCVRLSPEKSPDTFLDILSHLRTSLCSLNIVPLLCGTGTDPAYVSALHHRAQAVCPETMIRSGFMGPSEMAEVWQQTILNVHPSQRDAFGMTIAEAAAFGVPTAGSDGGDVGALDFLAQGAFLPIKLSAPAKAAAAIRDLLHDPTRLSQLQRAAQARALAWTATAHGAELLTILQQAATASAALD
ncbi:uncharacterized protein MONBRDRAFT_8098 [Monosiga brevicollis MX1]|uniref:Glycosyl transferase family 1 domain-containing protein n=1 Tax=Monosiga brevicollis TaxID=81824 RepID=A9UZ17_MONBE|nr:uncharacterized protein MONBRDRAFT_8098 [Monosiga brevicollis MX1]EDQ89555.1 predicted protein [Monosiga brevicollis MX1]|eukprot:XP_001745584.1 hypothetical protein [Monosiga brevicollis MX1]